MWMEGIVNILFYYRSITGESTPHRKEHYLLFLPRKEKLGQTPTAGVKPKMSFYQQGKINIIGRKEKGRRVTERGTISKKIYTSRHIQNSHTN